MPGGEYLDIQRAIAAGDLGLAKRLIEQREHEAAKAPPESFMEMLAEHEAALAAEREAVGQAGGGMYGDEHIAFLTGEISGMKKAHDLALYLRGEYRGLPFERAWRPGSSS